MTGLREPPAPTAEQLAQIEKLEAAAADRLRREEESFQRSDTDGFLSQWALNIGARLDQEKARLLRNGGYARFPVLCDAEGNVIADRIYKFPNAAAPWLTNRRWKLPDELAERVGRRWIPTVGLASGKSRIQTQLGLHEEDRWFPAYAEITTGDRESRGLSGAANAYVGVFKRGQRQEDE